MNTTTQMIAALGLAEGEEEARSLLDGAGGAMRLELEKELTSFEGDPERKIRALAASEQFSGIAEIHPAWLVETLRRESPRVIGVILRHLPSRHVRHLLEHLPRHTVAKLPKLIEAFYVPNEILNLVRRRFERHFVPMHLSDRQERLDFAHLHHLKMEELQRLFADLGLSEMALSLVGSSRQLMTVILNRFGLKEAREMLNRIRRFNGEEKWLIKDAKYSVLETGDEEKGAGHFLEDLGLLSFAKGFDRADLKLFEYLRQKLSPDMAYLFKRYLDEQVLRSEPAHVARRKDWIMEHIQDKIGQHKEEAA